MIGRIEGRLHHVRPGELIVDAGGVGYQVSTTLRAYEQLAKLEHTVLWIHTQVRADAIQLFGFLERDELQAFQRLIAVAGVGPRTALAVLSGLSPAELADAVESGAVSLIQRAPGVGKKTAERILLELKGRLQAAAPPGQQPSLRADVLSALLNLGYGQREATRAVDLVLRSDDCRDLGELLRLVLQRL